MEEVGWLSKRKKKYKTGNENSYQHIAGHVSALYVFVVVTSHAWEINVSLPVGYL